MGDRARHNELVKIQVSDSTQHDEVVSMLVSK